jgi:hypothetical protein
VHPTRLEACGKRIARAEHVENRDIDALAVERVIERGWNRAVDHCASERAALDHEHGLAHRAHGRERGHDVGAAAGDIEFLDGADGQVDFRQNRLQVRGHRVGADITGLAVAALGQAPQHGAIVDVENGAHVVLARAV